MLQTRFQLFMISKEHRRFQAAYLGLSENHRLLEFFLWQRSSIERAKVFQECLAAGVQNKSTEPLDHTV